MNAVTHPRNHAPTLEGLLLSTAFYDINIGVVALKLDCTFRHSKYMIGLSEHDLCIGTIARTKLSAA